MPIQIDQFEEVASSVFNQYPGRKGPGQSDPVRDDLLTRLGQGTVARLPYADERELRGLRLAVGRRAVGCGFKGETRHDQDSLVIHRGDPGTIYAAASPGAAAATMRGRRRTQDEAPDAIQDGLSETME
jgi:hypothetical protein